MALYTAVQLRVVGHLRILACKTHKTHGFVSATTRAEHCRTRSAAPTPPEMAEKESHCDKCSEAERKHSPHTTLPVFVTRPSSLTFTCHSSAHGGSVEPTQIHRDMFDNRAPCRQWVFLLVCQNGRRYGSPIFVLPGVCATGSRAALHGRVDAMHTSITVPFVITPNVVSWPTAGFSSPPESAAGRWPAALDV